ncbi:MAG: glycine betaine ABC transporter substrate-binding protein [Devosia sp.]
MSTAGRAKMMALLLLAGLSVPAQAQFSVLDHAQDGVGQIITQEGGAADAPPAPCGHQTISIASMGWPSAQLLAEIHARLLAKEFGCDAQVTPGDLASTGSSMGSSGQPAVAPEMWPTRIADAWNSGIAAQMLRPAAPTYVETQFEGWFVAGALALARPDLGSAAGLAAALPTLNGGRKVRFISCPADWACAVINRNLLAAYGLADLVEVVEPANRFEMDSLIAEAVSRNEAALFYYWQPNAVLAQLGLAALDMGPYDGEAAKCLAQKLCAAPRPSAFPPDMVTVALSEWVFTDIPAIAGYFQRSSLPLAEMNRLLAELNQGGSNVGEVADHFVAERGDIWRKWVGAARP